MEFETEAEPAAPSPATVNGTHETETGAQKMAREDEHGFILSIVSVSVVFCALIILWWLFSLLGKVSGSSSKPNGGKETAAGKVNAKASGKLTPEVAAAISLALDQEMNGEVYAAISTALHLYNEESVHDQESFVITIRRKESGWNNKEQNFRQLPR